MSLDNLINELLVRFFGLAVLLLGVHAVTPRTPFFTRPRDFRPWNWR